MQSSKSGSHTIWDCKYHIVWVTKYRYPVLVGDVGLRARELIREIARSHEMMIHAGAINRDHVHLLISIPPYLSVSRSVQQLSHRLSGRFNLVTAVSSIQREGDLDILLRCLEDEFNTSKDGSGMDFSFHYQMSAGGPINTHCV